jgi:ATP-dependent RNA helicase DHX37/DHR1
LYSSAVFENYFEEFSQPEILRVPIEGVVLQMKCMHIDAVANFPFPTPPDRQSLRQAEKMLTYLGALEAPPNTTPFGAAGGTVTDIGRTMSLFPLSPRFSKMLVSSRRHGCLPYAIAIVSAMSVGDPFLREEALGIDDEDSSQSEEEMAHISKETVRAKELSKQRRRAYFVSQQVYSFQTIFVIYKLSLWPASRVPRQVNGRFVQGPIRCWCLRVRRRGPVILCRAFRET